MGNDRIRIPEPEWSKNLWKRVKAMVASVEGEIEVIAESAIESISQNGTPLPPDANRNVNINADANVINTVKQNGTALTPDANKAVNIVADANVIESIKLNTQLLPVDANKNVDITAKPIQSPVSSPAASSYALAFIDTISQNANGVITATKKYMVDMTGATSQGDGVAGLVPAPQAGDEAKFLRGDGQWATPSGGGGGGGVTGVKGSKEVNYRTGDVNIDPVNIGASKYLNITATTLADIYTALRVLYDYETGVVRLTPTAAAILTGNGNSQNGKINEYVHGVVTRYQDTKFTFLCKATDGSHIYSWISTLADNTSCVTSTVYQYSGTAI